MPDRIRVACVQMTSRTDKTANLEAAEKLVAHAASTGADIVVLPEKWNAIGDPAFYHEAAEPIDGGESTEAMAQWARRHARRESKREQRAQCADDYQDVVHQILCSNRW